MVMLFMFAAYVPHMGLLYGHLSEKDKKEAQERANALDDMSELRFQISRIGLYKTVNRDKAIYMRSWEKICDCVLSPN